MGRREYILRMAFAWVFYLGGFFLCWKWFNDVRIGIVIILFMAGNNIERSNMEQ